MANQTLLEDISNSSIAQLEKLNSITSINTVVEVDSKIHLQGIKLFLLMGSSNNRCHPYKTYRSSSLLTAIELEEGISNTNSRLMRHKLFSPTVLLVMKD